jgi:hypothetical protein
LYPSEVDLLDRWCKLGGNPALALEAVKLFNAKIVRVEAEPTTQVKNSLG